MADTGIFATTAEVTRKAGANASATSVAEGYVNDYMTQVESYINVYTNRNWSDDYSGLNVDVKGILKQIASDLAAIYAITYDMSGMSLREAENRINVLRDAAHRSLDIIKEKKAETFIDSQT